MEMPYGRVITPKSVEAMHVRSIEIRRSWSSGKIAQGFKAALARDPKLMFVLEKSAETLDSMVENQMGETMRGMGVEYSGRIPPTDMQVWREAYAQADAGKAMKQFAAIYAAAGEFAGVVI